MRARSRSKVCSVSALEPKREVDLSAALPRSGLCSSCSQAGGGNNVFQARQLPHCEHIVGGAGDGRVQIRCLNRNGCGKPVKQGDASSSSSTVLAAPESAGPTRSPSTPLIQTPFLTCGEEDGIGLRVRRPNEGDQGRRDVPRLLRTKGVAQVGDPRPEVDGDTVGSPLPCRRGQVSVRPQTIVLLCREQGSKHNLHHLLGLLVPRGALGDLERGQCPLVRPGCLPEGSQRCLLPTDCQVS